MEFRFLTESGAVQKPKEASDGWGFEPTNYYLEGKVENAGLGHSFMAFNNLVALARQHHLMPRFVFQTGGHDLTRDSVRRYFFGNQFMSPIPVGTECRRIHASPELIPKLISAGNRGECKIFSLRKPMGPAKSWSIATNLPLLRKHFQLNGHQDTMNPQQLSGDAVTVAVHIRRGDLFSFLRKNHPEQVEGRLITESAYVSVLKQLISKLEAYGKSSIKIVLYCEGMKGSSTIVTVDGKFADISKEFSPEDSKVKLNWSAGSNSTLKAFDDMCHSDILITGTSGFSYVTSVLCSKPVILAFPFWLPYGDIPNAIELDVERGNYTLPNLNINTPIMLRDHARFNETKFDSLFSTKISSLEIE